MKKRDKLLAMEQGYAVEEKVTSVERVGHEVVDDAFHPHGSWHDRRKDEKYQEHFQKMIQVEGWEAYKATYQTHVSDVWLFDILRSPRGNESHLHQTMKLACAQFLDLCGHEFERVVNPCYTGESEYAKHWGYYDCLEVNYAFKRSDVACECDDHNLRAEVGKTSAEKFFSHGVETPDILVIMPYSGVESISYEGNEYEVYIFQKENVDFDWLSATDSQPPEYNVTTTVDERR